MGALLFGKRSNSGNYRSKVARRSRRNRIRTPSANSMIFRRGRIDADCGVADLRYARPRCEECVRLAAECSALYLAYCGADEELMMTPKDSPIYQERRMHLDELRGQLREARRREAAHEETHQDEYSS